jgi:hypothetical protein
VTEHHPVLTNSVAAVRLRALMAQLSRPPEPPGDRLIRRTTPTAAERWLLSLPCQKPTEEGEAA